MNPARVSEHHARAVLLITVLLAVAGFITLLGLPSDIYPPLNFPRVVIIGHTGTLPARSMLLSVTRPIEQVVMEVPGIRRVRSQTFRGSTEISAQFDPNADILQALQQVQNRVAELRGELPANTELAVERLTTSAFPILSYNLTGGLKEADLRDYAFYVVRPTIARVAGVGRWSRTPRVCWPAGSPCTTSPRPSAPRTRSRPWRATLRVGCSTSCSPPAYGVRWERSRRRR